MDEKEAVPFYKSPRFVMGFTLVCVATALLVFGYIAVDVWERVVGTAATVGAGS